MIPHGGSSVTSPLGRVTEDVGIPSNQEPGLRVFFWAWRVYYEPNSLFGVGSTRNFWERWRRASKRGKLHSRRRRFDALLRRMSGPLVAGRVGRRWAEPSSDVAGILELQAGT